MKRSDMRLPDCYRVGPRHKPKIGEPGRPISSTETAEREAMRQGSRDLLAALWRSHQRVLLVAKATGRQVVIPEQAA